jgi:predicted kinase
MRRFLLQMHGESGAGKSTLALAVGKATGAVVLDKDRIKAPLVQGGLEDPRAGGLAYDAFWLLAESFLAQGFSVVLDSPAFWPAILDKGKAIAADANVDYHLVECRCDDEAEQERRLITRERFVSQPASRAALAVVLARPGVVRELRETHLTVDTTQPLQACVDQVLAYMQR